MLVKLELTLEEINTVLAGLGELPAKVSLAAIEKIRMQVIPQVQQQPPAAMPNVSVEEAPSA